EAGSTWTPAQDEPSPQAPQRAIARKMNLWRKKLRARLPRHVRPPRTSEGIQRATPFRAKEQIGGKQPVPLGVLLPEAVAAKIPRGLRGDTDAQVITRRHTV